MTSILSELQQRINAIDPVKYGKTRNFLWGNVSELSPYVSRGVISTALIRDRVLQNGHTQNERLFQQLAWRDYFQRVGQIHPDLDQKDVKHSPSHFLSNKMPLAVLEARTGIEAIDQGIKRLYDTGMMHNHMRMYVAMLVCNVAKTHWKTGAQWMFHHLKDADFASNHLSWQWVCGAFSSKLYFANQENINKYCSTKQTGTFLDVEYDQFYRMDVPQILQERADFNLDLPPVGQSLSALTHHPNWNPSADIALYHPYHLDPEWRKNEPLNRIFLWDSAWLSRFPISLKTQEFIHRLGQEIPNLIFVSGDVKSLNEHLSAQRIYTREHPHFTSDVPNNWIVDERNWMFPGVQGFFPSFFGFWKRAEKTMK